MAVQPALRIALADPGGNVDANLDTISVAELAALLGLGGVSDTVWIADPLINQGAIGNAWNGYAYQLGGEPFVPNGIAAAFAQWGGGTSTLVQPAGAQETWLAAIRGAGFANARIVLFRPGGIGGFSQIIPFCDTLSPMATGGGAPVAYVLSAVLRKNGAGDTTDTRQWFGFLNVTDVTNFFARRACGVGLIGDGAGGFVFGAVNCPDASNNPIDPQEQAILSAGSVPAITPGASAFAVAIKCVPPIPGVQGGRIGCYLGDSLKATFTTNASFPRRSVSSIDVLAGIYFGVQAGWALFPNQDGVTVDPSLLLRDIRLRITKNTDLGATLT